MIVLCRECDAILMYESEGRLLQAFSEHFRTIHDRDTPYNPSELVSNYGIRLGGGITLSPDGVDDSHSKF